MLKFKLVIIFISVIINCRSQDTTRYTELYQNGKLKLIAHQGSFNGCGMTVGTDSVFYVSGHLFKTTFYDNRKSKTQEGCHATWTTAVSKTYYKNGNLKVKSQIKYAYEGEPCNCGKWIWYDLNGKIIKEIQLSDCYNQKYCSD